jgi:hypothetical protein
MQSQHAMAHQTYNAMGYNQRSPMTGMAPMGMNNYSSMGSVSPMMSSMNSMNSMGGMSNVNPMNHMMMGGGVSNMSGMTGMSPMNPMGNMNNVGLMNSAMNSAGVPINKMSMQVSPASLFSSYIISVSESVTRSSPTRAATEYNFL